MRNFDSIKGGMTCPKTGGILLPCAVRTSNVVQAKGWLSAIVGMFEPFDIIEDLILHININKRSNCFVESYL